MARQLLQALAVSLLVAMAPVGLLAKENLGTSGKNNDFYKAAASSCPAATSQVTLEINNIRTILMNGGDLWWDLTDARYEVPKIDPPGSAPSVHSLFAGAVWLGGIDAGGNLKIAAQTYRQTGNDFWPGPLDATATVNVQTCQDYDRHWVVFGADIDRFRGETFPCPSCETEYPAIWGWPAKGNLNARGKGDVPLVILDELAPYYDENGNGIYDPINGDYPVINANPTCGAITAGVYADQMIFWVYNDKGNIHTETGGQAIGVQVGALAFAFRTSDEVNNMTFYRYDILNRANVPIGDFYMGQWVDADLGCFNNDYVGCDTSLSLGYAYNGLSTDPDCATRGYGISVPIVGVDYFEGPFSGRTVNGEPEKLGMETFLYYENDFSVTGNPETAIHYYNYMSGFWKDGSPFTSDRANGYGGAVPTKYMFPSDPGGPAYPASWSECSANNISGDRRWMQASGPFTLQPGARNYITVGTVWVRQGSQSSCAADIDLLRSADIKAQALFNNCFKLVDGPDAPDLVIRELDKELIIMLTNAPTSNNYQDGYDELDPLAFELSQSFPLVTDVTYTFQGYILYQLRTGQVSPDNLSDQTQARIVAQVDVEDGISKIVNKVLNREICGEVPTLMVDGANAGIRRSFRIREDLFATGNTELVNHKTYYYTAIAYAHNYYNTGNDPGFEDTDCGPVPILEDQKNPFLQGRKNQFVYSAIPHKPEEAFGGTVLNSEYGDLLNITRIDGSGNGGFVLELTDESIDAILSSPDHMYGPIVYRGGNAPIQVQIVDPMMVRAQEFELYFPDTLNIPGDPTDYVTTYDNVYGKFLQPSSRWAVRAMPDDTIIYSEKGLEQLNEQLVLKYGISISLRQVANVGDTSQPTKGYLTSSIAFEDSTKQWLDFIPDGPGALSLTNWIRSGQFKEQDDQAPNKHFFDDHYWRCTCCREPVPNCEDEIIFYDPQQEFNNVVGGTWAPYALAANKVNTELTDPDDPKWPTNFSYGPGFLINFTMNRNTLTPVLVPGTKSVNMLPPSYNLDSLVSINLVLTSDKSKWTRCVVVETGEDFATNEGGSFKGQIRKAESRNKDGNTDYDINLDALPTALSDTGRSYFPGYAINVETGERLNMMFGENSFAVGENGRDMLWNPSKIILSPLNQILFGGGHYIYIMDTKYDEGKSMQDTMLKYHGLAGFDIPIIGQNVTVTSKLNDPIYRNILYTAMPVVDPNFDLLPISEGLIPSTTTIKIRVRKPLGYFVATNENEGRPAYSFSTDGYAVETNVTEVAENHLDQIRVVPNPYYAYSAYETSELDNRIKITNLPGTCTVSIFSIDGVLIRQFKRDVGPNTHYGENTEKTNLDSSLDWDLKNTKNIPVSSGVYIIHVEAPGLGERTVKWFGVMRPFDLGTF